MSASDVREPRDGYREAYESILDEMAQLEEEDLVLLNIDMEEAAHVALGIAPELGRQRAGVAAAVPSYDFTAYDNLHRYALAAVHANTLHRAASEPPEPVDQLVPIVRQHRRLLTAAAHALAEFGLIDGTRLKVLRGGNNHHHLATEVHFLVTLLRQRWDELQDPFPLTRATLDLAGHQAQRLANAVAIRAHGREAAAETAKNRQRAFTLFIRAYDEVRRIVTYVRWREGDVDRIVPSLYRGRGGRGRKATATGPKSGPSMVDPTPDVPAKGRIPGPTDNPIEPG